MKKICFLICLLFLCISSLPAMARVPMTVGGFTLGKDINDYKGRLDLETCREIRYQEFLGEGVMKPTPGFKSGLITFGRCDKINKIIRIKLKFLNPTKKFYLVLLKKYKKVLGPPDEYKGDPFQSLIAWKWSFQDKDGHRVSLTLQHNLSDTNEKIGNAVKLVLMDQLAKEKTCYTDKYPRKMKPKKITELKGKAMWDMYIPY